MSTTYSSSTKETTKADASGKDNSDSTYVRSADTTESTKSTTGKSGKQTTFESSTSDKSHDNDSTSHGFSKDSSSNKGGLTGQSQQYGQRSQLDQDSEQYRGGRSQGQQGQQQGQIDVQHKLKEVGNLLQRAGHLLQDLQGSSAGDFQFQQSMYSRPSGGNYGGPFGGFESSSQQRGGQSCGHSEHLGGPCSYGGQQQQWGAQHQGQQYKGWGGPSGEWSQYESQQRGPQQSGRWSEDREERGLSGRGNVYSTRNEDRFNTESSRLDRGNVDRYGGFGGPNRPDLAYGQQYGLGGQQHQYGQSSTGLGYRGDRDEGMSRRGGELEFSGVRRGADRF